jgi:hypothetical protein
LDKLDVLIRQGAGSTKLLAILKAEYSGPLVIPTRDTIESYLRARRPQLTGSVEAQLQLAKRLAELPPIPDLRLVNRRDRPAVMDVILANQAERVELMKELQKYISDPRVEQTLTKTLVEITETIEKQIEMDTASGLEHHRLQAILDIMLRHISKAVSQAYKDVHSDNKHDVFVKALEKRLDALPIDSIEDEVQAAAVSDKKVLNLPEHT